MTGVSYHVSAENPAWVLWKISLCSLTTEPSLQPELAAFLARSSLVSFATSSRDARSNEPASLSSLFHTCSKVFCTEEPSDALPLTREQPGSPNACVLHSPSNSAHPPCSLLPEESSTSANLLGWRNSFRSHQDHWRNSFLQLSLQNNS